MKTMKTMKVMEGGRIGSLRALNSIDQQLLSHPQVQLVDVDIALSGNKKSLAEQEYKPKWGVEAGYGWRDGQKHGWY